MKIIAIILLVLGILFIASQIWAQGQVKDIEGYPYRVIKSYDDFELRTYEEANFIYATMDKGSYQESSGKGFSILAGYIFGGNEKREKFAMTSPVEMEMDEQVTMKFLVPAQHDLDSMPRPDNIAVKFKTEQERTLAAITFSGFASDEKLAAHKDILFDALDREGLSYSEQWSFMGYDPPFKLINRRNEVVVEVTGHPSQR